jgi:hypothetical protein
VGVGTPPQPRTLIVDTGRDLIWTQCELFRSRRAAPAAAGRQREPLYYDPRRSSSFAFLPCCSRLCQEGQFSDKNCTGNRCLYDDVHGSAEAGGVLASETFTFGVRSVRDRRGDAVDHSAGELTITHTNSREIGTQRMQEYGLVCAVKT